MYHETHNTPEFTLSLSPRAAHLTRSRGMLAHLLFCRAQPSNEIQSTKDYVRNYKRFMQNKPNFQKSQMNVNPYITTDYERKRNWTLGESKPNSNPNKPNLRKAKMNVSLYIIEDYRKKDDFEVRINKPNLVRRRRIQNERKLIYSKGLQKKNDFAVRINKPNSNPISERPKMSASVFVTKDYENETAFRPKKTNPIQSLS